MTNKKKKAPFVLCVINPEPDLEPLKVILPNDGTTGLVIGEDWEVRSLHKLLGEYLESGTHSGEIPDYHEQLGTLWLTVADAVKLSDELGQNISERTIRWAAANNFIRGAKKEGRDWRFPQRTFLSWVKHRPKPGRKTEGGSDGSV